MTLSDKQTLVRLLNQYQDEQVEQNRLDKLECERMKEKGKANYKPSYIESYRQDAKVGTKAQYEHARLISSKLSLEISRELKSYWEL